MNKEVNESPPSYIRFRPPVLSLPPSLSSCGSIPAMCFPSKWLKKNFSDEDTPNPRRTKAPEKPAEKPADNATTSGTAVSTQERPGTFRTAIVIYTMYGHISSRESRRFL